MIYVDSLDPFYSINHHNDEAKAKQKTNTNKKEIITTKLVITMTIIAIAKIIVFLTI